MVEQGKFCLDLDNQVIETQALECLTKEQCEKYMIFPYNIVKDTLYIAVENSLENKMLNELKFVTRKKLEIYSATKLQIANYISYYYGKDYTNKVLKELQQEKRLPLLQGDTNVKRDNNSTIGPAIEAIDSIIINAVNNNASDIHIEPFREYVSLRFRIDGSLKTFNTFSKSIYDSLCTRIKIIAKMNIACKHMPQDGKFSQMVNGEEYDFRVSSLPTINGEKFAIRVLHKNNNILSFKGLGFTQKDSKILEELSKNRQGMILITGPTGSGKTSTLYSMLKEINSGCRNLVTVEEPVEYRLEGVNQVNVNNQGDLTFSKVLKAILRQDPDVIMVGEVIDENTAETAIRAALTGHLVLTTLHTNDAASSINRLIDMHIPSYLISDSILAVIAQRLARKICPYCKVSYKPNYGERMLLNLNEGSHLYRGKGCSKCNDTGYRDRTVAYEIMVIDEKHKKIICSSNDSEDLRKYSINNGMKSLKDYFRELVLHGDTTIEEYLYNIQDFNPQKINQVYDAI
jgi:type IV pilus assembly protein PilB